MAGSSPRLDCVLPGLVLESPREAAPEDREPSCDGGGDAEFRAVEHSGSGGGGSEGDPAEAAARGAWLGDLPTLGDGPAEEEPARQGELPALCGSPASSLELGGREGLLLRPWLASAASWEPLRCALGTLGEGQVGAGVTLGLVWLVSRIHSRAVMLPALSAAHLLLSLIAVSIINYDSSLYELQAYCMRYGALTLVVVLMTACVQLLVLGFPARAAADMWGCVASCSAAVLAIAALGQHMLLANPTVRRSLGASGRRVDGRRRLKTMLKLVLLNVPVLLAMAFVVAIVTVQRLVRESDNFLVYGSFVLGAFCIKVILVVSAKYVVSMMKSARLAYVELTLSFIDLVTCLGLRFIINATDDLGSVIVASQLSSAAEVAVVYGTLWYYRSHVEAQEAAQRGSEELAHNGRKSKKLRRTQEIAWRCWDASCIDVFVRARTEHAAMTMAVAFSSVVGEHRLFELGPREPAGQLLLLLAVQIIPEFFVDALGVVVLRHFGWSLDRGERQDEKQGPTGTSTWAKTAVRLLVGPMVAPLVLQASLMRSSA